MLYICHLIASCLICCHLLPFTYHISAIYLPFNASHFSIMARAFVACQAKDDERTSSKELRHFHPFSRVPPPRESNITWFLLHIAIPAKSLYGADSAHYSRDSRFAASLGVTVRYLSGYVVLHLLAPRFKASKCVYVSREYVASWEGIFLAVNLGS